MKFRHLLFSALTFLGIGVAGSAGAVCPVCVVAIAGGLGLSRWLGVDDVVSSIWIGAILASFVVWTMEWVRRRNWKFPLDTAVITVAYYALTFVPLYYAGVLGHPANKFLGTDKIIFGSAVGSAILLLANWLHLYLKKRHGGKSYFSYQKVIIPVSALLLSSIIFYSIISIK